MYIVNQDIFLVWQDDQKNYTYKLNFLNFSIRSEGYSCTFVYKTGVNATHFILFTKYYLVSISPFVY